MRKALVIGGSGGIGKAVCQKLMTELIRVVSPTRAEMDVSKSRSVDKWLDNNEDLFDIFIYCAGINRPYPFKDMSGDEITHCMEVNVNGFLRIMKHLSPYLIDTKGKVVAITSLYDTISRKDRLAYTMSKHALSGCVKSLAIEYADDDVLVNSVSPGFIDTAMTVRNNDLYLMEAIQDRIPLGRLGEPEDIAEAVLYLASPKSKYVTGADWIIDGGYTAP